MSILIRTQRDSGSLFAWQDENVLILDSYDLIDSWLRNHHVQPDSAPVAEQLIYDQAR